MGMMDQLEGLVHVEPLVPLAMESLAIASNVQLDSHHVLTVQKVTISTQDKLVLYVPEGVQNVVLPLEHAKHVNLPSLWIQTTTVFVITQQENI